MTTPDPNNPQAAESPDSKVAPEPLELRAQPRPVTRINRKVLIGTAAVVLFLIAGLVLLALRAPSLRVADRQELFNVEHKPITDALSKLPASYDGLPPDKKPPAGKGTTPGLPKSVPAAQPGEWDDEAERAEKALLARMEAEARKSSVFFRLQLKAPPKETVTADVRPEPPLPPTPTVADGGLTALPALRAAERAVALAGGDLDALGAGTSDQTRKLTFLKSGPEKDIYNPHALQTPASPYQLMAGTVIAGLRRRPGHRKRVRHRLGTPPADPAGGPSRRQVRQHRRLRPGARARGLAARYPAQRHLRRDRQPPGNRYRRLCRSRRSGRLSHLEASEGRGPRNGARRWQRARLRTPRTAISSALCSRRRRPPPTAPASA